MRVSKYKTSKSMQEPPQTERLTAPFGQPTDSRKKSETGKFMQADNEPVVAWIWPIQNGKPEYGVFYRLK
jgi:hypothetical protein